MDYLSTREQGFAIKEVVNQDNVWIGRHVIILPGVRLGTDAIMGAVAVVTKDVPLNAAVGGNLAKIIKYRTYITGNK